MVLQNKSLDPKELSLHLSQILVKLKNIFVLGSGFEQNFYAIKSLYIAGLNADAPTLDIKSEKNWKKIIQYKKSYSKTDIENIVNSIVFEDIKDLFQIMFVDNPNLLSLQVIFILTLIKLTLLNN